MPRFTLPAIPVLLLLGAAAARGQDAALDKLLAQVRQAKEVEARTAAVEGIDVLNEAIAALGKCGRAVAPLRQALAKRQNSYFVAEALGKLARSDDADVARAAVLAVPDVLAAFDGSKLSDEQMLMTLLPAFGP